MLSACSMETIPKHEENVHSHFCVPVGQITCFFYLEEWWYDLKNWIIICVPSLLLNYSQSIYI